MGRRNPRQINEAHDLYTIPSGAQTLTVDDTTGGVQLAPLPAGTRYVEIQVQTAEVRMTTDGIAPTASGPGLVLAANAVKLLPYADAVAAKFIRTGGSSGAVYAVAKTY